MPSNSMLLFIFQKKAMYKIIGRLNKMVLPSFTKQNLNLAKAKKWQLALIGYRYFITCRALE